jgi:hypothetical protein
MELEMSRSGLEYAGRTANNFKQERAAFIELLKGDSDKPPELYRSMENMVAKYVAHMRAAVGDQWRDEDATHIAHVWLTNAVFILAGLYFLYGKTFPNIRPEVMKAMEQDCEMPEKIRERRALLESYGDVSREWVAHFLAVTCNESSPASLCGHGIAYIFALAAAFIHEMEGAEDTSDAGSLSEADHRDIASRVTRLCPLLRGELDSILETKNF